MLFRDREVTQTEDKYRTPPSRLKVGAKVKRQFGRDDAPPGTRLGPDVVIAVPLPRAPAAAAMAAPRASEASGFAHSSSTSVIRWLSPCFAICQLRKASFSRAT